MISQFSTYLIIMHNACSSCNTLSKYIISKSDTIAPLITIISSPLIIPVSENKTDVKLVSDCISNGWLMLVIWSDDGVVWLNVLPTINDVVAVDVVGVCTTVGDIF